MIGPTLRTMRQTIGLSQRVVAARAGIQQSYLSALENGRTRPTLDTITRVADAMGCDAAITLTPRQP